MLMHTLAIELVVNPLEHDELQAIIELITPLDR